MDHDERRSSASDEPPHKKQRVLACRRCRSRKQKCQDLRPCANCVKSGDECLATEPAPRPHVETEYVKALEGRIAELESRDPMQSQDHMPAVPEPLVGNGNGHAYAQGYSSGLTARRLTQSSGQSGNSGQGLNSRMAALGSGSVSTSGNAAPQRPATGVRRPSEALDPSLSGEITSVSPANQSIARRSHSHRSPGDALSLDDDSDAGFDHLIYGLVTSPSVREDGHPLSTGKSPLAGPSHDAGFAPQSLIVAMSPEVEELLLSAYRERAQAQYPFFYWGTFLTWHREWKSCPPSEIESRSWQGFFVNLVYATALLLLSMPRVGQSDARTFYRHGVSLLPRVLRQSDPIIHVQAYLLLSMHALHRSSTPRLLSLASTTMRYCVQLQLHLNETEPEPTDPIIRLENQVRRRCFWSAYCLDRLVMGSFELPPSVSDVMITCRLYSNIDDEDLEAAAARTPPDSELLDSPVYTCVSSSLHILQCRRIQSEIFGYTLRWDYKEHFEESTEWRIRILNELESYKSRVQNFSDPQAKGYTSGRWLAMIYHYTLLTLYRPTKESVLGPAGDWSIQASSQACLMFRKSQMTRQIAQSWLGLLVQFQSGVTLLYCCWATPPEYRTENYDSPDVSDALRACSNILAIMADRWPKADCLRDVFELLAREVPLVDRPSRPPSKMSDASAQAIREKLPFIRSLIVHRSIMRMIEEMITDEFPRLRGNQTPARNTSRRATPSLMSRDPSMSVILNRQHLPTGSLATANVGTAPFELPFTAQQVYVGDATGVDGGTMSADELLAFPGMFDLDSWT